MCKICKGDYDINMTVMDCTSCETIKEIPILPNLRELYCYSTEIKEIPYLPKLCILRCEFGYFNNFIGFYPFNNNKPIKHFYVKQKLKPWFNKYYWLWKEKYEEKLMHPESETFKMFCEDKYF